MADAEHQNDSERTEIVNPITQALNKALEQKAARPQHVYRLAVILEGVLDSMDDPDALKTIQGELHALVVELSETMSK